MSTQDVPGLKDKAGKSIHNDELAMGCWAEHEDGSLIFVESVEGGQVVYSVFDLSGPEVIEYRDSMHEGAFKKAFSWTDVDQDKSKKKKKKSDKDTDDFALPWIWHDKSPFPWDRVMTATSAGARHASADHLLSAAERVAHSRKMHARKFDYDSAMVKAGTLAHTIKDKLQRAIGELRR